MRHLTSRFTAPLCWIAAVVFAFHAASVFAQRNLAVAPAPATEQRVALVIGNSAYKESPLRNPVNDATDMAAALKNLGFSVILRTNASRRQMVEGVREFGSQIRRGGVGFFYYAGHGVQSRGRNYLLPVGAQLDSESDLEFESVDASMVLAQMDEAGNRVNIVVLDACRDNPFARSFRSASRGLAQMDSAKGSFLAYATSPGSVAADGSGRNGVYTKHLLQSLKEPETKLEEVFKRVRLGVAKETGNKQIPWDSSSVLGDFFFRPSAGGTQVATMAPSQSAAVRLQSAVEIEQELWDSIKDSRNVKDFEDYLSSYPSGRFAVLARTKARALAAVSGAPPPASSSQPAQAGLPGGDGWILVAKRGTTMDQLRMERQVSIGGGPEVMQFKSALGGMFDGKAVVVPYKALTDAMIAIQGGHISALLAMEDRLRERIDSGALSLVARLSPPTQLASLGPSAAPTPLPPLVSPDSIASRKPGTVFRDCADCPEMVVIPAGSFMMGEPAGEPSRDFTEGPQHSVTIAKPFAAGKFEVTFREWDACLRDGGCRGYRPDDRGLKDGRQPIFEVSWQEAKVYIDWLSRKTGRNYRLLSESEWEYAARGGSTTAFSTGATINPTQANYSTSTSVAGASAAMSRGTVSVGSYPPNAFGLHDVHGNVFEWTEDCMKYDYNGAPADGSAWMSGDCGQRVVRGGSWGGHPRQLRSAARASSNPTFRSVMGSDVGFRVARSD